MAELVVTEYTWPGDRAFAREPAVRTQTVIFTTATQSAPFAEATGLVRLVPDADCHVLFGSNPTATAAHEPLAAGGEHWRLVTPGDRLSVIESPP